MMNAPYLGHGTPKGRYVIQRLPNNRLLLDRRFAWVQWIGQPLITALVAISLSSPIAFADASEEKALKATRDSYAKTALNSISTNSISRLRLKCALGSRPLPIWPSG
jgi:hypothetical protein